jgi:hypothetical protein
MWKNGTQCFKDDLPKKNKPTLEAVTDCQTELDKNKISYLKRQRRDRFVEALKKLQPRSWDE